MASEARALPPPPSLPTARAFTLGRPASRLESITLGLVSFFDLLRPERDDDRPPLARTLTKLVLWIVLGVGVATASAVALAVIVVRDFASPFA